MARMGAAYGQADGRARSGGPRHARRMVDQLELSDLPMRRGCRHASDARLEGDLRAPRRGVGARGEVGRRARAHRGPRRPAADVQPQRQRHHRRLARAQHVPARRARPAGRRRDHRPQRARSPGLPDAAGPDAPAQRADGPPARRRPSRRRTWSSTCSVSTARTSPASRCEERRARLEGLGLRHRPGRCRRCTTTGRCCSTRRSAQGLEGVVSKRRSSKYQLRPRTDSWLKLAHRLNASFVVGGWRPQEGSSAAATWPPCWWGR